MSSRMPMMSIALILLAVLIGQHESFVAALEPCTGKVLSDEGCGDDRSCLMYSDLSNTTCAGESYATQFVTGCVTEGAQPGDNCKNTTTTRICAIRYKCKKITNTEGELQCVSDTVSGNTYNHVPQVGGDCVIPE